MILGESLKWFQITFQDGYSDTEGGILPDRAKYLKIALQDDSDPFKYRRALNNTEVRGANC